jgi:uncharacterized protein involved in exopolysaccharide biosynthesis
MFPAYKAEMTLLLLKGRVDPAITALPDAAPWPDRQEITEEELNSQVELLRDQALLRSAADKSGLAHRSSWIDRLLSRTRDQRIEDAAAHLKRQINIQPARKSHLISVSYQASNPQLSASVLQSLAEAYLARQVEVRRTTGQLAFFEEQIAEARRALESAQNQLMSFSHTREVASAPLERDLTVQKLVEAKASEMGLQAAISETEERVRALDRKLRELPEQRVAQIHNSDNPQLQEKLKSRLLELQLKRTELLTKFQPSYRLVQEVEQEIAQTREALSIETSRPLRDELTESNPDYNWVSAERVKALVDLQALEKRRQATHAQISHYQTTATRLAADSVEQNDLEQKVKAAEDKYLLYTNKREEARISEALDKKGILNVLLEQPPRVPMLPVWPLSRAAGASFVAALFVSTCLVFGAERFNTTIRTPAEAADLLGMPVLASFPNTERSFRRAS